MYYVLLFGAWIVWNLVFRIRVYGKENLVRGRGFVLAPNHISAIDPVFVIIARFWGAQMRIFAKQELFQVNAFVTWFLTMAGGVAVRGVKDERAAVDRAIAECRAGRGLLVFPEGTRSKDGGIGPLKSGAFVVAAAAGVDLVPCRIIYGTRDGKMHLFCRVHVCFGRPIPAAELAMGVKRDIARLRANKQRLLDEWAAQYALHGFSAE